MNTPNIPISVKIFTWFLILVGCFFFYVYTFSPNISFPNANLDTYSAKMGFGSAGVRILGSVLALLISVVANKPKWLFITLISRIFIELGDLVLGFILDGFTPNVIALSVLASLEIWAVWKLLPIQKEN